MSGIGNRSDDDLRAAFMEISRQLGLIAAVSTLVEIIRIVVTIAAAEQRGREHVKQPPR